MVSKQWMPADEKENQHCGHQDPGVGVDENQAHNGNEDFGMKTGIMMMIQRRKKLLSRLILITLMVTAGFIVFTVSNIGPIIVKGDSVDQAHIEQLIAFLHGANPDWRNFTYDQLKQWYENQIPKDIRIEEHPRLFPYCVTSMQINDTSRVNQADHHLHKFYQIIAQMEEINEKFFHFNQTRHSTVNNTQWIKDITLTRINTPDMDMVNLRQWIHIRVETTEPVMGLYMQSIVGPMGLPFGEFHVDFPCQDVLTDNDAKTKTADMNVVGQLSYCSYRPRALIQHPSVYVGYKQSKTNEFHMNFFWTDITCMETPYVQFLFLVVKDFDYNLTTEGNATIWQQFAPQLSPVYINTGFDSHSGAPFPYYPEWKDKMYCYLDKISLPIIYSKLYKGEPAAMVSKGDNRTYNIYPSPKKNADPIFEGIKWETSSTVFRVQANEQYDACILGKLRDPTQLNEMRLECPPGPFQCDTQFAMHVDPTEIENMRKELVKEETAVSKCLPCSAPPCLDLGFPEYKCDAVEDKIITDVNNSLELNQVESIIGATAHGIQAMLAFLILVPISNFMARFYKEVCSHFFCGNGPWIFIHIISHILSIVLMWFACGPVMPKLGELKAQAKQCSWLHEDKTSAEYRQCIQQVSFENPHIPLALIAFMLQHLLVANGFFRFGPTKLRNIQVGMHSHLGYGSWLLGAISAIFAGVRKTCPDILIMSIMAFITPLIFSAIAASLDCLMDKRIGILPVRRQWPVLEQVKLKGRGPFTVKKWIVFGVFTGTMLLYWFVVVGNGYEIVDKAESSFGSKTNEDTGCMFSSGVNNVLDSAKKRQKIDGTRVE